MRETVWFSESKHTVAEVGFAVLSFFISFYLLFLPYNLIGVASPAWPLMTLFYWLKPWPRLANLTVFWGVGFLWDILSSSVIGVHALALVIVYWLVSLMGSRRMASKHSYSGAFFILLMVFVFQVICCLVQWSVGGLAFSILYFTQTLLSALLWPWFVMVLKFFHQFCRRGV
jgi:rod shape-determining protein MreD